jgi:hypothetical protein
MERKASTECSAHIWSAVECFTTKRFGGQPFRLERLSDTEGGLSFPAASGAYLGCERTAIPGVC